MRLLLERFFAMPTYSYQCTNPACQHKFELERPSALYADRGFCPRCNSLAERQMVKDASTIKLWHNKPKQTDYQPHPEPTHIHNDRCGCAMTQDWQAKIAAIEAQEALER
jgi:putative FmdB family regulatory protein